MSKFGSSPTVVFRSLLPLTASMFLLTYASPAYSGGFSHDGWYVSIFNSSNSTVTVKPVSSVCMNASDFDKEISIAPGTLYRAYAETTPGIKLCRADSRDAATLVGGGRNAVLVDVYVKGSLYGRILFTSSTKKVGLEAQDPRGHKWPNWAIAWADGKTDDWVAETSSSAPSDKIRLAGTSWIGGESYTSFFSVLISPPGDTFLSNAQKNYFIMNATSASCMDLAAPATGTPLLQKPCWTAGGLPGFPAPTARWRLGPTYAAGYNLINASSTTCLDLANGNKGDLAQLQGQTCSATENQRWNVNLVWPFRKENSVAYWSISNVGSKKCVDLSGGDKTPGAPIKTWRCLGATDAAANNQQWALFPSPY